MPSILKQINIDRAIRRVAQIFDFVVISNVNKKALESFPNLKTEKDPNANGV